jgi:hypothetical protein
LLKNGKMKKVKIKIKEIKRKLLNKTKKEKIVC